MRLAILGIMASGMFLGLCQQELFYSVTHLEILLTENFNR